MEYNVNVDAYAELVFGKSIQELAVEQFNVLSVQADRYVGSYKGDGNKLGYTTLGDDVVDYPVFVEVCKQARMVNNMYKRYVLMQAVEAVEHTVKYSCVELGERHVASRWSMVR